MNPLLPKTGIITINWRNCQTTIECLESLLKQDYPDFLIFILENGSGDGSAEKLQEWGKVKFNNDFLSVTTKEVEEGEYPSVKRKIVLIKSDENLGFAGGNNFVIPLAIKMGAKYIWLINNDTVHEKNALTALVQTARSNDKVGMACSKVLYFNKPDIIESLGSTLILPLGIFRHIKQGLKDSDVPPTPMEAPYVYGCSFIISTDFINDVGLMDERYFLLREESDWSIRGRRRDWKIYSSPDSVVWHKVTSSMGKRSAIFFYYVTRNSLLFMLKHYPLLLPVTVFSLFPLAAGLILSDSLFSERKKILGRIKMVALGYMHFFKGRFGRL